MRQGTVPAMPDAMQGDPPAPGQVAQSSYADVGRRANYLFDMHGRQVHGVQIAPEAFGEAMCNVLLAASSANIAAGLDPTTSVLQQILTQNADILRQHADILRQNARLEAMMRNGPIRSHNAASQLGSHELQALQREEDQAPAGGPRPGDLPPEGVFPMTRDDAAVLTNDSLDALELAYGRAFAGRSLGERRQAFAVFIGLY